MKTIKNHDYKASLIARVKSLSPDSKPLWGTLTPAAAICHLNDTFNITLEKVTTKDRSTFVTRKIIKNLLLIFGLPIPKGKVKAAKEMFTSKPTSWEHDIDNFETLLDEIVANKTFPPHPGFGPLTHSEWCKFTAIHIDHHLKQFGA